MLHAVEVFASVRAVHFFNAGLHLEREDFD
jgi:hypothetical protein